MKETWKGFSILFLVLISPVLVEKVKAIHLTQATLQGGNASQKASIEVYNPSVIEGSPIRVECSISDLKEANTSNLLIETPSNEEIESQCDQNFFNTSEVGTYLVNYTVSYKGGGSTSNFTWFKVYPSELLKSTSWSEVEANETKVLGTEDSIGFRKLKFSLKKNFSYLTIRAENFMEKPELEKEPVSGLVYQYFRIEDQLIKDEDVKKAKVIFSVSKPWLTTNKVVRILLERCEGGKWKKYQTNKTKEEANDAVYKAKVPGFSYFAISGEKEVQKCNEGAYRCFGNSLEKCNNNSWQLIEVCEHGCNTTDFTCNPEPLEEVCEIGSKRCFEGDLQECRENKWETFKTCEYGCNSSTLSCNPKPQEDICEEGIKRCFEGKLQECKEGEWKLIEACHYGCNSSSLSCNPRPEREPSKKVGWIVVIGVIFLILLSLYFFSRES